MNHDNFGWNLMVLMAQRGYSVNEIAARSGIPPHQIRRLRSGTRKTLTQDVIVNLATALEVTPNELLLNAQTTPL